MRTAAICPTCATYTNAVCVLYDGPAVLTNIPANPLDNMDQILVALNTTIGNINTTLATLTTPTLSQVLNSGNTATNQKIKLNANVGGGYLEMDATGGGVYRATGTVGLNSKETDLNADGIFIYDNTQNYSTEWIGFSTIYYTATSQTEVYANPTNFNNNLLTYPSGTGTFAIRVNGVAADNTGNVTLPAPYKVYTAVISQAGTAAPTVDYVLQNTLGYVPTWSYISPGRYHIVSPAFDFLANKVVVFINPGFPQLGVITGWERNSDTYITIHTQTPNPTDPFDPWKNDLLLTATIELRIYP